LIHINAAGQRSDTSAHGVSRPRMLGRQPHALGDHAKAAAAAAASTTAGTSGLSPSRVICYLYAAATRATWQIYAIRLSSCRREVAAQTCPPPACARPVAGGRAIVERTIVMLDVIYLLVGAGFLGLCVLYAYACDHL